jgi:membrane protease YdiL (CAAX protease family)
VKREGAALLFAMVFPTLMAWWYFVGLASAESVTAGGNPLMIAAYILGKVIQFGFPLVWVWSVDGKLPRLAAPSLRGVGLGLAFGALVVAGMFAIYFGFLRYSPWLAATPAKVQEKIQQFGLKTPAAYIPFAVFLSVIHSLMEEYYWRWFVFGRLRHHLSQGIALVLSSVAFTGHHVIVLAVYFPGRFWELALPFSVGVCVGGAVFAWLYERTGSLYAPWAGHILIDTAIMVVGYDMVFGYFATCA